METTLTPQPLPIFVITILAGLAMACGPAASQRSASTPDIPSTTPLTTTPSQQTAPVPPVFTTPADLHFSAADTKYLNSVDPATRDLAIQQRRDEILATQRASKITDGYANSLKHWSISHSKAPPTR
jgi:hypothetical protein